MNSIKNYEHPYVCSDAIVFSIKTEKPDSYRKLPLTKLMLLLYQRNDEPFKGKWCLPGGFLNIDELPEDSIKRKLSLKANVTSCYLEQLFTFCGLERDPRGRVISIAYLGLMSEEEANMIQNNQWFTIDTINNEIVFINNSLKLTDDDLGFDHFQIIQKAIERLQAKIQYTDIIFNLLPKEFTLTQLQNIYETILGKKDTPANFRRKISSLVKETDKYSSDMGHRPAKIFAKR